MRLGARHGSVTAEEPWFATEPGWPASVACRGVLLAPFRRRDIPAWERVRTRNRAWLAPWDATSPPGAPRRFDSYRQMVAGLNRDARRGRCLPWLIWFDAHGDGRAELAGQLTVSSIVYGAARSATVGYWIDQRWAGRGIMPMAVALATDYCFQTLRLHRVEISIRPENAPSLRAVTKLGFRHEGLRPRYLHIAGDWRDHESFALHAEEVPHGLWRRLPSDVPRRNESPCQAGVKAGLEGTGRGTA